MTSISKGLILDRRSLIAGASALGIAGLMGRPALAQETPVRGGVFVMGIGGGSTTDDFDLRKLTD